MLHKYSIDHAVYHLAKYTDLNRVINKEFKEYKDIIYKIYEIPGNKIEKHLIIENKICLGCSKRCLTNRDFCSQSCANKYKDNSNISIGLKKYYSTVQKSVLDKKHKKVQKTLLNMYSKMSPDERRLKYSNKIPRYTAYNDFSNRFKTLVLDCTKEFYYNNVNIPIKCIAEKDGAICNNKFTTYKGTSFYPICRKCNPKTKHKTQNEIYDYITSLIPNISIMSDTRTIIDLELDIYIPELKLAIEYNGIPSHSFGKSVWCTANNWDKKDSYKHLRKTEMCNNKDIKLLHINEYEWQVPKLKEIWKSMIKSALKLNTRIFARKCYIKEITGTESAEFTKNNHLQGTRAAKIHIGLFYKDELIQVMSLGNPMQNKYRADRNYELIRLCSKLGINIVGGASKLLRYFELKYKPNMIISYANRRWANKNPVYNSLNFKYIDTTKPGYCYCKLNSLETYSRQKIQKHKLKSLFGKDYNDKLSSTENIINNGFRIFYDCGNMIFIKKY